jgi:hypothetical protein
MTYEQAQQRQIEKLTAVSTNLRALETGHHKRENKNGVLRLAFDSGASLVWNFNRFVYTHSKYSCSLATPSLELIVMIVTEAEKYYVRIDTYVQKETQGADMGLIARGEVC